MKEHGTPPQIGSCRNCESEVPISAIECTYCGFRPPQGNHVTDIVYLIVGNLLTLTIIGALVGIPLMRRALRRLQQRSQGTAVRHDG